MNIKEQLDRMKLLGTGDDFSKGWNMAIEAAKKMDFDSCHCGGNCKCKSGDKPNESDM